VADPAGAVGAFREFAVHYFVDRSNLIIEVGDDWDAVAAEGEGGPGATRASIVGRPLEAFMLGDATKMFVRSALDAARILNQTRVLPYRCDSADQRRRFEMVISPQGDGRVLVEHQLVEAIPKASRRGSRGLQARAAWRCSQCLRVRFSDGGEWEEADTRPGLTPGQDVCPRCAALLFDAQRSAEEFVHERTRDT